MQCSVHRANGETFTAEVWFSTYTERRAPKLAAIIADISEDFSSVPCTVCQPSGNERPRLNDRQMAVLRLVLEGLSCNEMALRLATTSGVIKKTLQQLYSKTGVHNRSQMVRFALEHYPDLL